MKSSKFFALAVVAVASVFSQATILSYSTTGYQFDGGQVYDGTYNYYYKYHVQFDRSERQRVDELERSLNRRSDRLGLVWEADQQHFSEF